MRLHQLSVTAFGPFADRVEVDFDELNDAGLFLLTGATGAGKSSLLDAVCFALYGTVPGARGVKTLKSQHAGLEARPEVELDFSVQGRRFVVRRTPEWSRPKRRGEGMRTENASATLTETTGGTEHFLSSRAAEVGHLVNELMGMTATQFVQVALLPQGEFQTFLRASSQERHGVLQQLFRTDRFSRIEDWVHEHSRLLKDRSETGRADVQRLVEAAAERSGVPVPEELCGDRLPAAAAAGDAARWVSDRAVEARAARDHAHDRLTDVRQRSADARGRAARLRTWQERRDRGAAARAALAELDRSAAEAAAASDAVDRDARAARCEAVLELHRQAEQELDAARLARDAAVGRLASLAGRPSWRAVRTAARAQPEQPDAQQGPAPEALLAVLVGDGAATTPVVEVVGSAAVDELTALGEDLQRAQARLEALWPRTTSAERARDAIRRDEAALSVVTRQQQLLRNRASVLPAEIAALATRVEQLSEVAGRAGALSLELQAARARARAAERLVATEARVAQLEDRRRDARDQVQDTRDQVQELVRRRLLGMAAELAGALSDGVPCSVCGSPEHPAPAAATEGAVTDEEQEAAEARLEQRRLALEAVDDQLQQHRGRRDADRAVAAGWSVEQAAAGTEELTGELATAEAARVELARLRLELTGRRSEHDELGDRQAAQAAECARLVRALESHRQLVADVGAELVDALGDRRPGVDGPDADTLESFGQDLRAARAAVTAAQAAFATTAALTQRVAAVAEQARATAVELGFEGLAEVAAARLTEPERTRLAAALARRATETRRAEDVLAEVATEVSDEHTADLLGSPAGIDLDAALAEGIAVATADVAAAEDAEADAAREAHLCDDRTTVLDRHLARLEEALVGWAPARDESLVAESMSRLVRGLGHDNQLQMRLSSYVLATRLDQVVAAANERLGQMRDQRYLLQRTARAEDRRSQAGLGLEVIDQWTGDVRSPRTLSGGETFVVSLSLALGLADVVTHEAGGTEIETLFVDEGFGTLDADTLDDVMDRLDGLRAGGRTVGVVSHVTELRARIPTQVHVEKGRAGSTVSVRTLVG